jgi:hypothetical protein
MDGKSLEKAALSLTIKYIQQNIIFILLSKLSLQQNRN